MRLWGCLRTWTGAVCAVCLAPWARGSSCVLGACAVVLSLSFVRGRVWECEGGSCMRGHSRSGSRLALYAPAGGWGTEGVGPR